MSRASAAACKAACYEPVILLHTKLSVSMDMRNGTLKGVTEIWVYLICERVSCVCKFTCLGVQKPLLSASNVRSIWMPGIVTKL